MNVFEKYYRREFQVRMLFLDHDEASDFYLSSCQNSGSAGPLLFIRAVVFFGCLSIVLASAILTVDSVISSYWPIFLTSWGLVLILFTSGSALAVSLRAYFGGPIEPSGLPWYVKVYWALYNLTVPVTYFITAFYYIILTKSDMQFSVNPVLSVFVHAVNAVLMLLLLIFSRQPTHLLHCTYSLLMGTSYLIFSLAYYFAGGTNPHGSRYIYPMLDWSDLSTTATTVTGSAVMLLTMHLLIVVISTGRNWLTGRYWIKRSMDIVHVR